MVEITPRIMMEGMRADFRAVDALSRWAMDRVKRARAIRVTSPAGTDITATFSPALRWVKTSGIISREAWGNLPGGEIFTSPAAVDGTFVVDVLPSMVLLGFGAGMAFNPLLLAAMGDVPQEEAGLASGVVNTAFMMGGALGLAVLASLAAARTDTLAEAGGSELEALTGGYHAAFLVGAIFAAGAAALGGLLLRPAAAPALGAHGSELEPVTEAA